MLTTINLAELGLQTILKGLEERLEYKTTIAGLSQAEVTAARALVSTSLLAGDGQAGSLADIAHHLSYLVAPHLSVIPVEFRPLMTIDKHSLVVGGEAILPALACAYTTRLGALGLKTILKERHPVIAGAASGLFIAVCGSLGLIQEESV